MAVANPFGSPAVVTPHFRFPFTLTDAGVQVVEQDTIDEVFSNVEVLANTPVGSCPEMAGLGVPDLTFAQTPLDPSPWVQAVQAWEPRADESVVVQALDALADQWQITATISVTHPA